MATSGKLRTLRYPDPNRFRPLSQRRSYHHHNHTNLSIGEGKARCAQDPV